VGLGLISCELEWPQWFELRTLWESPTISAHIRKELGSSICSQVNTGADIDKACDEVAVNEFTKTGGSKSRVC
jgi:molybdopterin biosynthesis enzyme